MTPPPPPPPPLPHPPHRLPLLGDTFSISFRTPMQSMVDMAPKVGPIFASNAMGANYVMASGSEFVAELNDEKRFAKHVGPELVALRAAAGNGLFTADNDDPQWHAAHRLLAPAFGQSAMRRHHAVMVEVAGELTAAWDARIGDRVDVTADMTRTALEAIGRTTAGFGFGGFPGTGTHPFVRHMVRALHISLVEAFLRESWLPNVFASVAERRVRQHGNRMGAVVNEMIAARRASPLRERDDLLSLMLFGGPNGEPPLEETNVRYQLITFLIAGHETTSGAMSFALHHLSLRPDVVAVARAEIDRVWGECDQPTFEQVTKLRYVRRVLDETLRLHPTVPGYFRVARADTVLHDGYRVAAGDWFLVLVGGLHRDSRWGERTETFDPDRFLPERVRARPAHLYKPFGTGMRSCIGRQFAIHEAVLVLATLLRRYDLTAEPGYRLRTTERLTSMPMGLRLTIARRPSASESAVEHPCSPDSLR